MKILLKLENAISTLLIQENHNELEKEKIKFGIRLIVNDFWKMLIIYLLAFLLGCFIATFITHCAFVILRQVCFGFHFQNSIVCLVASAISLPIGLYAIRTIASSIDYFMLLLGGFATISLLLFAPVETEKRPIFNLKHRNHLRKKMFIRLAILWLMIFFLNGDYPFFLLYAILLIAISVITQKILGGKKDEN